MPFQYPHYQVPRSIKAGRKARAFHGVGKIQMIGDTLMLFEPDGSCTDLSAMLKAREDRMVLVEVQEVD